MGCHTWHSVPNGATKEEIIKKAQEYLASDSSKWMTESTHKMYQWAVDNELCEPCCSLAFPENSSIDWTVYLDITDWSLQQYNKEHGTNFESQYDAAFKKLNVQLEYYSDEPRIGGYPKDVIRSYDELVKAMETGLIGEDGTLHQFRYDESRKEAFMQGKREFFEKHPDGIITFG
jgi:hypothetical protein